MYLVFNICIPLLLLKLVDYTSSQPMKCDQTPTHATILTPSEDTGLFRLNIANVDKSNEDILFTPLQTYVLTLETTNDSRPFRWFMLTAEDPEVDNSMYDFGRKDVDVGSLKTLDEGKSRYSERCASSVETYDNTDKYKVDIQWVSPEHAEKVRIRAMVAENAEAWYTGPSLTIILSRDNNPSRDTPPLELKEKCNLCSEARYEVIFTGHWSRLAHPLHYPSKPDENGYSHMVGASHDLKFSLWRKDTAASPGMQKLAEEADVELLEREIINNMQEESGTRTLIRGKRRHHPHMHEPSYALFRVDRFHHLFSIAVAMKPSPDWFLGTNDFELCMDNDWLDYYKLPLYPWDAGTMDGVSYESPKSVTQPVGNIGRVEVGSFNDQSPFYQMNLNDLKPFAFLEVRRLDVYPLNPAECAEKEENANEEDEEEEPQDEPDDGPRIAESRLSPNECLGEWTDWSPCIPDVGDCGIGSQTRSRLNRFHHSSNSEDDIKMQSPDASCLEIEDTNPMEIRNCIVEC